MKKLFCSSSTLCKDLEQCSENVPVNRGSIRMRKFEIYTVTYPLGVGALLTTLASTNLPIVCVEELTSKSYTTSSLIVPGILIPLNSCITVQ